MITLLTDFGTADGYAGALEGAIRSAGYTGAVAHISHAVPAWDRIAGSLALLRSAPLWPQNTVHLAVIDPGVGSERRIVAVWFSFGIVMAPDNGLLHHLLERYRPTRLAFLRQDAAGSPTFEARDRMAGAAAQLVTGDDSAWSPADSVEVLSLPQPRYEKFRLMGAVIDIDHFGTLITNVDTRALRAEASTAERAKVFVGNRLVGRIRRTFSDVELGLPVALWGSMGLLEIACREGRADGYFRASRGVAVELISPVPLRPEDNEEQSAPEAPSSTS